MASYDPPQSASARASSGMRSQEAPSTPANNVARGSLLFAPLYRLTRLPVESLEQLLPRSYPDNNTHYVERQPSGQQRLFSCNEHGEILLLTPFTEFAPAFAAVVSPHATAPAPAQSNAAPLVASVHAPVTGKNPTQGQRDAGAAARHGFCGAVRHPAGEEQRDEADEEEEGDVGDAELRRGWPEKNIPARPEKNVPARPEKNVPARPEKNVPARPAFRDDLAPRSQKGTSYGIMFDYYGTRSF